MTTSSTLMKTFDQMSPLDRSKIERDERTQCWVWTAARDQQGYGQVKRAGRTQKAHRYIYELFRGAINTNVHQLDHTCRNRACVNPDHLEPVTAQANVWRGMAVIDGDLPRDLVEQMFRLLERAYKRGVHDGIRQVRPGPMS
jgi:hypothetical protein